MTTASSRALRTLLTTLTNRIEDRNYSRSTLRNLFLVSSTNESTLIPINELTRVLQIDFAIPVTPDQQELLLKEYGIHSAFINIKFLLQDIGWWDERNGGSFSSEETSNSRMHPTALRPLQLPTHTTDANKSLISHAVGFPVVDIIPPPITGAKYMQSKQDDVGSDDAVKMRDTKTTQTIKLNTTKAFDMFSDLVQRSSKNIEGLSDIHRIVTTREDLTEDLPEVKKKIVLEILPRDSSGYVIDDDELSGESKHIMDRRATSETQRLQDRDLPDFPVTPTRPTPAYHDSFVQSLSFPLSSGTPPVSPSPKVVAHLSQTAAKAEDDHLLALTKENERLKQEMQAFDLNFFEELEDLKYRYSRLQEVVGEEPSIPKGKIPIRGKEDSFQQRPIDR